MDSLKSNFQKQAESEVFSLRFSKSKPRLRPRARIEPASKNRARGFVPALFELSRNVPAHCSKLTRLSGPVVREVTVAPRNPASRAIAFSSDAV
jgi:hypothetical protein